MITILEHNKSGYPARTKENVLKSDVTMAFAMDFNSAGEKLTKRLCKENGKMYVPISLLDLDLSSDRMLRIVMHIYNKFPQYIMYGGVELNIAGNGIYSLPNNQEFYNDWFTQFFNEYTGYSHNLFNTLSVRSGGQSGADEGGIVGANKNGYDCTVLAPKGWLFRGKDHKDISNETLFKQRFQ